MTRRYRDYIGERFGALVVLGLWADKDDHYRSYYKCRCDCGVVKNIACERVLNGKSKSCGCGMVKAQFKAADLTGRRFGRLTAIERVPDPDARRPMWRCQCDCGNETTVMSTDLTMGCVKSCGCLQHEVSSKNIKKALDAVKSDYVDGTYIKRIQSTGTSKANKSGITGVSWDKSRNKWVAQIMFKGRAISLGRFDGFERAVAARKEAEDLYFKPIIEKYKK